MIVGVAGFSILAILTMIVSEKYRDIGILKSLGASNRVEFVHRFCTEMPRDLAKRFARKVVQIYP